MDFVMLFEVLPQWQDRILMKLRWQAIITTGFIIAGILRRRNAKIDDCKPDK